MLPKPELSRPLPERSGRSIRFLFPNLPAGHPAEEPITTNMIANILGLGWAATPAGLKAMEELSKLEEQRRKHLAPVSPALPEQQVMKCVHS